MLDSSLGLAVKYTFMVYILPRSSNPSVLKEKKKEIDFFQVSYLLRHKHRELIAKMEHEYKLECN